MAGDSVVVRYIANLASHSAWCGTDRHL